MNSHLSTLNLVCAILAYPKGQVHDSFEFGCGEYSTEFFARMSYHHIFVETLGHKEDARSVEWFNKMKAKCGEDAWIDCRGYISDLKGCFDILQKAKPTLVFVDGPDFRPAMVQESFNHTHVVIAHDTEEASYGWNQIIMPDGWYRLTSGSPEIPDPNGAWTTVWTDLVWLQTVLSGIGMSNKEIPRRS